MTRPFNEAYFAWLYLWILSSLGFVFMDTLIIKFLCNGFTISKIFLHEMNHYKFNAIFQQLSYL